MGLFQRYDEDEREALNEQTVHVAAVERDNGVKSATYQSISSALYDLADRGSLTHTVRLPHGTVVKLASPTSFGLSSYRSKFEITNGSDTPKVAVGASQAADLAKEVDVLAMSKKEKTAIQQMTEEEAPLQEASVKVSGYVTREGKHVGAYSQVRDLISKLSHGQTLKLPDGITVKRGTESYGQGNHFFIQGGVAPDGRDGSKIHTSAVNSETATKLVAARSAASTHPKSLGGTKRHEAIGEKDVHDLPAENPKLPGTPHPDAVAKKAAAARKAVKLPSRKERAENERRAGLVKQLQSRGEATIGDYTIITSIKPNRGEGARYRIEKDGKEIDSFTDPHKAITRVGVLNGDKRRATESKGRRARDESGMPGIIRRPSESDEIRRQEGERKQRRQSTAPLDTPGGFAIPPRPGESKAEQRRRAEREEARRSSGSKGAKPNTDGLATYRQGDGTPGSGKEVKGAAANIDRVKKEMKGWSSSILSREIDAAPPGELHRMLTAEQERRKHGATKARRRHQGLAEGETPGLIGR